MASPLLAAMVTPTPPPNVTYNEKGALSYRTTESSVLDWFASGGALRHEEEMKIQMAFRKAFAEDKLLATKIAFYHRDIRGGNGQRRAFRAVLGWLAKYSIETRQIVRQNLSLIPVYGRWDDLWVFLGTRLESDVIALVKSQLAVDKKALRKKDESVSLLGKWMPSANTSSLGTRTQARRLIQGLGMTPRTYRKMLSELRARINVVERFMCSGAWSAINYEHVPSRALMVHRKAFPKHDPVRFAEWKGKAFTGNAKVHAATLYPYDIVHNVLNNRWDDTLELQWRNLPDYFKGEVHNGLVVCDVSGSMLQWNYPSSVQPKSTSVKPMDIALSLALYMAERMNGPFKDHFITFSGSPELQHIKGNTLFERAQQLQRSTWATNTNVQAVFELILNKARANGVVQKDMPDAIYIVSDLQFDACQFNQRNFDAIKAKYAAAGYKMPMLVFWQVRYNDDKVALKNEKGVVMVSGYSPAVLQTILKLEQPKEVTPYELMLAAINSERYAPITV